MSNLDGPVCLLSPGPVSREAVYRVVARHPAATSPSAVPPSFSDNTAASATSSSDTDGNRADD